MSESDRAPFGERYHERNLTNVVAWRVVNPDLAPPGFTSWVAEKICAHLCRGF